MKTGAPRILVADDQSDVIEALRLLLKGEGYQTEAVTSPAAIMDAVEARDFDTVLMDLNYTRDTTSGQEGLEIVSRIHSLDSTLPVVVMTAWGSPNWRSAMRRGRGFRAETWEIAALEHRADGWNWAQPHRTASRLKTSSSRRGPAGDDRTGAGDASRCCSSWRGWAHRTRMC
jgi:CheY-like chemotaxis protein